MRPHIATNFAKMGQGRIEMKPPSRPLAGGTICILAFQMVLGLYASALNHLFYANNGPFYDSLSYYNTLAQMQITASSRGAIAALFDALYGSTIVFPWVLFAPFATFLDATRSNAVWLQIIPATIMQLSLFFYFFRVRSIQMPLALIYSATFVLVAASFNHNGGLADFRVDLLQYLLFVTCMTAYLIARRLGTLRWWALFGISAGLVCLARTTTPVYLAPIFVVLASVDILVERSNLRAVFSRWLTAAISAILISGWFFVTNFDYLYYYYVVWNQDANANLPIFESIKHVENAVGHIGSYLLVALVLNFIFSVFAARGSLSVGAIARLNWRPLLFSAVPLGYLVLSGSGLNPFVSITGTAGLIMFLLDPIENEQPNARGWLHTASAMLLLAAGLGNMTSGIAQNTRDMAWWIPRQEAVRAVNDVIVATVRQAPGPRMYRYAFVSGSAFNDALIFNTMYYDLQLPHVEGHTVVIGENWLAPTSVRTSAGTTVEWDRLPGTSDDDKIEKVVQYLAEHADFLVTATEESKLAAHVLINRFVPEINRRLSATGQFQQIAGPVQVNAEEAVVVYRNTQRSGDTL